MQGARIPGPLRGSPRRSETDSAPTRQDHMTEPALSPPPDAGRRPDRTPPHALSVAPMMDWI